MSSAATSEYSPYLALPSASTMAPVFFSVEGCLGIPEVKKGVSKHTQKLLKKMGR